MGILMGLMKGKTVNVHLKKKRGKIRIKTEQCSVSILAISDHMNVNAHHVKKFFSLSFLSLETSIADHCSSIFVAVFVTKKLHTPPGEQAKLQVKLRLKFQLSLMHVQAEEDRQSFRL